MFKKIALSLAIVSFASFAFASNPCTVDITGASDGVNTFTDIQAAIDSWCTGGTNAGQTPPFVVNVVPSATYPTAFSLDPAVVGHGNIVGDLVVQSSVPGTLVWVYLRQGLNAAGCGIPYWQTENDVTFVDMMFMPTSELTSTMRWVRIDEAPGGSVLDTLTFENCLFTNVDATGAPLVTSRQQIYTTPAPTSVGVTTSYIISYWPDATELTSLNLFNCSFFGATSYTVYAYMTNPAPQALDIYNCCFGPSAVHQLYFRTVTAVGTGAQVTIRGDDIRQGPDHCTVFLQQWSGDNHCCYHGYGYGSTANMSDTIINVFGPDRAGAGTDTRPISGSSTWALNLQDVILNNEGSGAYVDGWNFPTTWQNMTNDGSTFFVGSASTMNATNCVFKRGNLALTGTNTLNYCGAGVTITGATLNNCIMEDPIYVQNDDPTALDYMDVRNYEYGGAGVGGTDIFGGADFVGDYGIADGDLMITEIMDGPLTGGLPKFIEVTAATDIPDLSAYDLGAEFNAATDWSPTIALPAIALSQGDTFIVANTGAAFQSCFGFLPDATDETYPGVCFNNGDDRYAVLIAGTTDVVDIYGEKGVDGTGLAWEFLDSRAYRKPGVLQPNPIFDITEWIVMPINDNDGLTAAQVGAMACPGGSGFFMAAATQIGTGTLDAPSPALVKTATSGDLINGVLLSWTGNGLHAAESSSGAAFTNGSLDAAEGLYGLLGDANGNGDPSSTTFVVGTDGAGAILDGINMWAQNADARQVINCHIYLDTTDDATVNPTYYGQMITDTPGGTVSGTGWQALYITDVRGNLGGAGQVVYNVKLDFFSVTDAGSGIRGEGAGAGGTLLKEIDVLGTDQGSLVEEWIAY